jgi:hypothetical protein
MKTPKVLLTFVAAVGLLASSQTCMAQAVAVTMSLDKTNVIPGEITTLHVYAQVVANLRTNADRIFSWYVDVLNTNGSAASANYAAMTRLTSDNDVHTSSSGSPDSANRRGIYDTFLNLPGAGTSNRVELLSIPVTGSAAGKTRFAVQAGTGVNGLSADFLVAPKGGGAAYQGGDYSAAFADLTVSNSAPCSIELHIASSAPGSYQLTFTPCAGRTHTVEVRGALEDVTGWQSLPGGPHNSGAVTVSNTGTQRFFRVRVQ